jgi:hypothetical protein
MIALMLAAAAHAGSGSAWLEIDNDFEGELLVYVDGRYEGTARGRSSTPLDVKSGRRSVSLQRPGGAELVARSLHFHKGITTVLPVASPVGTLRVSNPSEVPLQVDVGPGDGVWISPGTAVDLRVTAGTVSLEARVREAGRVERVTERTVWVEPGAQRTSVVLDYTPTSHTRLSLRNEQGTRLRAVIDDRTVAWLDPGERQSVAVAPGAVTVRFYDSRGRLVDTDVVHADRGRKTAVVASGGPVPASAPCGSTVRVALR